ncbi:MAG TPA: gliding motility-associated C-terminal domain-containing protein, partial [Saprospiraceae bacterium]|nr:gliding motility-associated C-terminal domain-containing protein [Saprospiraceae bacterium]
GKYCLNITTFSPDGIMCHDSSCVLVKVDSNAPTSSIKGDTISCFKDSVFLIGSTNDPISKFDWAGPNGFTNTKSTIKVGNPGQYTLVVTAPNLCSSTSKYTLVSLKGGPNISVSGDTIDCNIPNTTLTGNSITPFVSYKWFDQNMVQISNTNLVNVSIPGNYSFQVYNTKTGCDTSKTVKLTGDFLKPQNLIATGDTFSCLIKSVNVKAISTTSGVIYNWIGPLGFISSLQNPAAPNAGDYIVIATGTNGCKDTTTAEITADTLSPSLAMINDTIDCFTFSATVSASSNGTNPTFNWSGPSGNSTNQSFTVALSGQYLVTVTDSKNGCTKSAYANAFDDPDKPKALAQVLNPLSCDSLQVALIGGSTINLASITYNWYGPSGFSYKLKNSKASIIGDYSLIVYNSTNGCADTTTITVNENITQPDVSALGDTTDCISGKANLKGSSATQNAKFEWFDAGNISLANTANTIVNGTGTFTLIVTDPVNGCTSETSVLSVKDDDTPDLTLSKTNDLNCLITSVDLLASSMVSGLNYTWSGINAPGTSTTGFSTIVPDTFTVKVTNPTNGCINSASIIVSQDITKPIISAVTDTIKCNNNKTAHIDGTSNVLNNTTVVWSTGVNQVSNILDFNTSVSQSYTLTVTNNTNGCIQTFDLFVPENIKLPNISVLGDKINCYKPIVTAKGNSTTPNVTYQWTGPIGSGYLAITKDAAGITSKGDYTLVVTDNVNGCSDSQVLLIDEDLIKPDLTANGGTLTCTNQSQINLTANSTVMGANYKWLGPNFNSNQQNPIADDPGTYTVTITNPVNGCTTETSVLVISDEEKPDLSVNNTTLDCINTTQKLTAKSITPGVTYLWIFPDGTTNTNSEIDVTNPGDYTIIVTSPNGCDNTKLSKVNLNAVYPVAIANAVGELNCTVKSIPVNTTGSSVGANYIYAWTGPSTVPSLATKFSAIIPGIYSLTITDFTNGCTKETSVTVPINNDIPTGLSTTQKDPNCFGSADGLINVPTIIGGTDPFLYSINGKPFSSQNQFTFLKEGTYKISIQDAVGCEYDTLITLIQPKKLVINAGKDSIIKWGTPITLSPDASNAANIKTVNWSPALDTNCINCLNPTVTLFDAQLFTITVQDSSGCLASDKVLILVQKDRPVYIPNTFSPNGDGINDHLGIFTGDGIEEITNFQIYDRWGSKVFDQDKFEPNQQSNGWDGTFRGKKLNSGVFVYWALVKFKDGESILYKGDVTLQR